MNLNELMTRLKTEPMRGVYIVVLSGAILLGSGISLGVGISQLNTSRPNLQAQGFSPAPSQTDLVAEPAESFPININTASATDLESLPKIGSVIAQRIIDYRKKNGPLKTISVMLSVYDSISNILALINCPITVK